MSKITLTSYNSKTDKREEVGTFTTYDIVRSITLEQLVELLSDFVNAGMKDYRAGEKVGELFQNEHRTLQGSFIRFCLGAIVGLSKQEYTDARNETPVEMGKKIAEMLENGTLKMGYMI
jgi:hypothetical protein